MALSSPPVTFYRPKPLWRRMREHTWGYLFLAPILILVGTFIIYPIFASVYYAFYNWDGVGQPTQFVGLRHFFSVATDPYFWSAFQHTIIFTAIQVPVQLLLALILALVLNNARLRFSNFYRALYFLPVVTSTAVIGIVFNLLFSSLSTNFPQWMVDNGWVNPYLGITGDPRLALPTIITIGIWQSLGINMVYFLAALQGIPQRNI